MTHISIISATNASNLKLAHQLKSKMGQLDFNISCEIIALEDYDFPLYTTSSEANHKNNDALINGIAVIQKSLMQSEGIIWCVPEYNGGIPPIVINAIAWISRSSKNWRQSFMGKYVLLASNSGSNGRDLIYAMRMQLAYIGMIVLPQYLIQTTNQDIKDEKFLSTLNSFLRLLP